MKIKVKYVKVEHELGVIATDMRPGYELYVKGLPQPEANF